MPVDVLSEVLSNLEFRSRPWFRAELRGPYAIAVPGAESVDTIRFHVVTGGACTLAVRDEPAAVCEEGDLVLVPHGAPHVLADRPGRVAVPLERIAGDLDADGIGTVLHGDAGSVTTVVCGEFRFEFPALHPFIASLPPQVRLVAAATSGFGWVEPVLRHIEHEASTRPTGHASVIRRLSEILLIAALRAGAGRAARRGEADAPASAIGALSALADPQIARTLEALHQDPAAAWSLDRLARIAGQSRTAFVEGFRARLGLPPMRYLAVWRMQQARRLLASSDAPVGEIARRVGYASESAFNRTFREQFGTPPGAYRKARTAA